MFIKMIASFPLNKITSWKNKTCFNHHWVGISFPCPTKKKNEIIPTPRRWIRPCQCWTMWSWSPRTRRAPMRHGGTPHSEVGTSTDSTEPRCSLGMVKKPPKTQHEPPKKTPGSLTFPLNPGCLIGTLIMMCYNPHVTGYICPIYLKQLGIFSLLTWQWNIHHEWVDVFPIENENFPRSC